MPKTLASILELRAGTLPESAARRLADDGLELWFQERAANDERFAARPPWTAEDLFDILLDL